ncbi:MAG: GAF domain-containing protein, partial [Anaerolineae bacterium]|nr:GAF domain-containing protein [Anaerolineae bacterium]
AAFFNNPDLPDTRSEMALPLKLRVATAATAATATITSVIGVLDVQSTEPEAFSDEDISVLQALADQVALAISNARLFVQVQENLEAQQRAYGQLSVEAWRALSREQPDLGFIKFSGEHSLGEGSDHALSEGRGNSILPIANLWDPEAMRVIETGKPIQRSNAALAVPIKSGDQVIAVFDAHLPAGARAWTSEQVALLETLSEQVAQAMERARLYRETQRRAARERILGQAGGRMRESLELENVLKAAAIEIRQAIGLDKIVVRLAVPESQKTGE